MLAHVKGKEEKKKKKKKKKKFKKNTKKQNFEDNKKRATNRGKGILPQRDDQIQKVTNTLIGERESLVVP